MNLLVSQSEYVMFRVFCFALQLGFQRDKFQQVRVVFSRYFAFIFPPVKAPALKPRSISGFLGSCGLTAADFRGLYGSEFSLKQDFNQFCFFFVFYYLFWSKLIFFPFFTQIFKINWIKIVKVASV